MALTFIPLSTMSHFRSRKALERIEKMRQKGLGKDMDLDKFSKRAALYAVRSRKITRLLLIIPGIVVAFTLLSGVERTPLTGRCVNVLHSTSPVLLWV